MTGFLQTTRQRVPAGLRWPEELDALFSWVEEQGLVTEGADGELYGQLSPNGALGTDVSLRGAPPSEVTWIDDDAAIQQVTVWPFARTGWDGSWAALWLAPDGRQHIVHLGSISGSLLYCVLGETPVDFLRLLAIGYDEICWHEDWNEPPEPHEGKPVVNPPFVRWVTSSFGVTIPSTGLEIVPHPAELGDDETDDSWCQYTSQL